MTLYEREYNRVLLRWNFDLKIRNFELLVKLTSSGRILKILFGDCIFFILLEQKSTMEVFNFFFNEIIKLK